MLFVGVWPPLVASCGKYPVEKLFPNSFNIFRPRRSDAMDSHPADTDPTVANSSFGRITWNKRPRVRFGVVRTGTKQEGASLYRFFYLSKKCQKQRPPQGITRPVSRQHRSFHPDSVGGGRGPGLGGVCARTEG